MSEFVNTKDVLGNQNTLDSMINQTITEFADEDLTKAGQNCFRGCRDLRSVSIPNVTQVNASSFEDDRELSDFYAPKMYFCATYGLASADIHTIKFATPPTNDNSGIGSRFTNYFTAYVIDYTPGNKVTSLNGEGFRYLFNCFHLILRLPSVIPLGTATSFCQWSPIHEGYGWIYVPDNLVDTVKETTGYLTHADRIVGISQYPKAITGDTITDTWEQIFAAEEDGTYSTKYSVGDTKFLTIRNQLVLMEIVAFDRDYLSDDSGRTAKITWMTRGCHQYSSYNRHKKTTLGGWTESELKQHIIERYLEPMDATVKSHIKQVIKYSRYVSPSGVETKNLRSDDYIWAPSLREMVGSVSAGETKGVTYSDYYSTGASRKKYPNACTVSSSYQAYRYMLRTLTSASNCMTLNSTGGQEAGSISTGNFTVVFGFCT